MSNVIDLSAAGPKWNLALPDWERRLMNRESLIPPGLPLNLDAGDRGVRGFNKLRLADVPGTPTLEEAGADWFRDIVRVAFGCLNEAENARAIRELFLLVPKKNSKTTYGALLMLLLLMMNKRPRGKSIMTAPVKDVAQVAYDAIAGAIALDPVLDKIFHVRDHIKTIVHRTTKAELQIMTFDPEVLTGQKLFAALIDELHVVAKLSKSASALRQIRGGMLPFPESLLIFITTQSEDAPAGVFKSELTNAREIRDGKRKGSTLPILYEFPERIQRDPAQAWKDPTLWPVVTPNEGRSIDIPRLYAGMQEAEAKDEGELRAWGSQHLNIEIGVAMRSDGWSAVPFWEAASDPRAASLESLLAACEVVEIGIDGGGLDDLLGLSVVGRTRETNEWLWWTRAWANPIVMERRKDIALLLKDFEKQGDLVFVDKPASDIADIVGIALRCENAGLLDCIGLDPFGVGTIMDALLAAQIAKERLVGISQGWKLGSAIKTAERSLAEGKLKHGGQPLLAWSVGNAKGELRGNGFMITKQASGSAKIDPLISGINAIQLIAANPEAKSKKYQILVLGGKKPGQPTQQGKPK